MFNCIQQGRRFLNNAAMLQLKQGVWHINSIETITGIVLLSNYAGNP